MSEVLEQQLDDLITEFETTVWPVLRETTGGNGQHRCVDAGTTFDIDVVPGPGQSLGYVKVTCDPPGNAYTFSFEIEATETDSTRVRTYTNLSRGALNAFRRVLTLWSEGQFTRSGPGQKGRRPTRPGGRPDDPGPPNENPGNPNPGNPGGPGGQGADRGGRALSLGIELGLGINLPGLRLSF